MREVVKCLPFLGSALQRTLEKSKICETKDDIFPLIELILPEQGTDPRVKKCNLGKGTKFTASFLKLELSWPGNLIPHVTPLIALICLNSYL